MYVMRRSLTAVVLALHAAAGMAVAARPDAIRGLHACERSARRYEMRCLMPRIEARLRLDRDGDPVGFVARMRDIDHACAEVTAAGLESCVAWPRVRPTAEYRRWLREISAGWHRRQVEIDGARPACPPGVLYCL
jgi:hypothetical protein